MQSISHRKNPAVADKLKSVCIVDGNSKIQEDIPSAIIKLPGDVPEAEVFNYVRGEIAPLAMQLAVALHLSPEKDAWVKKIVEGISISNRDPHLLFHQVGRSAGLIPANIVSSAFIGLWLAGNVDKARPIADMIAANLEG
ncbi:hypothetical protein AAE026_06735 [Bradyrhizobium sp. DN5]|uniref:hypothetical protein n=1 Tax=Bradyrhizobium sp. DN5 TaxID=3056950 RepID=UPI00352608A7